MTSPLSGITVLELGGKAAVPFVGMLLADLGADVVVCRRPDETQEMDGVDFSVRGKRIVRVDLKDPRTAALVRSACSRSDVVVEGFRPGVVERLSLGPEDIHAFNPRVVYARVTGYGQDGPDARTPGHDINFAALSGALGAMGTPAAPPPVPLNIIGDLAAGGLLPALGILAALVERQSSGHGQTIDASMTDGSTLLMTTVFGMLAGGLWDDAREHNFIDGGAPFYTTYETADGEYVAVGAVESPFYSRLLELCGLPEALLDRQFDRDSWSADRAQLSRVFATRTRAEWCERLDGTDTCVSPVLRPSEVSEHHFHRARGTFIDAQQPAPAPRFSRTPSVAGPVPEAEHTREVLREWGAVEAQRDAIGPVDPLRPPQ